MKFKKDCKKFRELVNLAVDNEITASDKDLLKAHLNSCPECRKYMADMKKMVTATRKIQFKVPPYIENRIMASIRHEEPAKTPSFKLIPSLSYAASFAVVMLVSLFIIYSNFDNTAVQTAAVDEPAVSEKIAVKTEPAPATEEKTAVKEGQKTAQTTIKTRGITFNSSEKNISVKTAENRVNDSTGMAAVGDEKSLAAAKVTPVPDDGNPLLEKEKAFVGNNLINASLGECATIRVKVEEPSRLKIVIYDKNVRKVYTVIDQQVERNTYEDTWCGKTDRGETVAPGVYFVYFQIGTRVVKKYIIVKK